MDVIVITGAGSGMGRACVERAFAPDTIVIAADLVAPAIDGAIAVACDITEPAAIASLAERVAEAGTFRSLIHAAGISPTMGDARRVLDVDLVATERLLVEFGPLVLSGSAAVCFSSSAAYAIAPSMNPDWEELVSDPLDPTFLERAVEAVGGDSGFAYAIAKIGVIRAAARAAVRWGPLGGRVNSLAPGIVDTPMGQLELANQPAMQEMLAQTPLGRLGQPDEIAAVAMFLVSDEASFLTGIDVLVDGGQVQGATTGG